MKELPKEVEIVVIGGGVFGCSLAYHLARKKREVILLEAKNLAWGASGRNGGQVIQLEGRDKNLETIKLRLEITQYNNLRLGSLEEELGVNMEYKKIGSLDIALTDEEWEDLKKTVKAQREAGDKEIELLDKKEVLRICPLLTSQVKGGRFRPSDGVINPFFYTHAFAWKVEELGGEVFTHTPVRRILEEGRKVKGVEIEGGKKIKANIVVNATNAWATSLTPSIQIIPLRQVAVVTEPFSPLPVFPMEAFIEGEAIFTTTQTESGNLVVGGFRSQERTLSGQFDLRVDIEELRGSTTILERLFPEISFLSIIRSWSGVMATTGDFLPAIGKVPDKEGLFISAGFYNGMAYATAVGELLAEYILTGKEPSLLKPFSPQRLYRKRWRVPDKYNVTTLVKFFERA